VPFPACLTCRFRSAEIGLCSGQPQHEPGRSRCYKVWNRFNRQNRTSTQIPRSGDTPRRALQPTWRCAMERLRIAISCLLNLPNLECRDRTLQQTATARTWPLQPLQILAPLQPSKSNLDPNPPQRGHSPNGPANCVVACSGATHEYHFLPAYLADFGVQKSESAADIHSTKLAAPAATKTETASTGKTVKIEPRRQYPAPGTLPDGPCKLRGGVLWSDSGVPFPGCLLC